MRVSDLCERALRWRLTPVQARAKLIYMANLLKLLCSEKSDAKRLKLFARFEREVTGYHSLETLVELSAVANPSKRLQACRKRVEASVQRHEQKDRRMLKGMAEVLAESTGISRRLADAIILARWQSKPYRKTWPIKDGWVTGPKGKMPLEGKGSPYDKWVDVEAVLKEDL